MAKGKYEYWLTEEGLTLLKGWARNGLTDEDIARNMGIATGTLYRWKNEQRDICEALKESKEAADLAVVNALYQKALAGDTTAMIFWLKNRMARTWRDKQEIEIGQDKPFEVKIEIVKNESTNNGKTR